MNWNDIPVNQTVALQEMLDAREKRCILQQKLLNEHPGSLICLTLNIPGPVKILPGVPAAFTLGLERIQAVLDCYKIPILHMEFITEKTGCEAFLSTAADANTVKAFMIPIEDQDRIGRLFDIDVLRADGSKVSREDLSLPGRKCLLCSEPAQVCARSRRHTVNELVDEISKILETVQN